MSSRIEGHNVCVGGASPTSDSPKGSDGRRQVVVLPSRSSREEAKTPSSGGKSRESLKGFALSDGGYGVDSLSSGSAAPLRERRLEVLSARSSGYGVASMSSEGTAQISARVSTSSERSSLSAEPHHEPLEDSWSFGKALLDHIVGEAIAQRVIIEAHTQTSRKLRVEIDVSGRRAPRSLTMQENLNRNVAEALHRRLPPEKSAPLARIVQRCLQVDAEQRWSPADIHDALQQLR